MGAKTTREIAAWACNTSYDVLPSEVVQYSKILALSHLGQNLFGATTPFGQLVIDYVKARGGSPEAGVFGCGFRTSIENAALANGNSAHTPQMEDDSFPEALYSCGVWPVVFALGENLHVSGKDIIEALNVGFEAAGQLGLAFIGAVIKGRGNHAACATISSAISAGKMLKLNVEQMTNALSLAASQAAGITRQTGTGAHLVEAGFAGRNGVCAAFLAKEGFTGDLTAFEGEGGFGDLWSDLPAFDLPLGESYRIMQVNLKKYPGCFHVERNLEAVFELIAKHNIEWDDVESVEHGFNYTLSRMVRFDQPENGHQAIFSLTHSTVACFFEQDVPLRVFGDEVVRDPKWSEARKKVKIIVHPEWPLGTSPAFDSPVTIRMKDGTTHTKLCLRTKGDPSKRLGIATKKFMDCVAAAGTFSRPRAEQIAEMTLGLEGVADVAELTDLLTFPDKA